MICTEIESSNCLTNYTLFYSRLSHWTRWILPRFEDPSLINRLLDPHTPEKFATQGGGWVSLCWKKKKYITWFVIETNFCISTSLFFQQRRTWSMVRRRSYPEPYRQPHCRANRRWRTSLGFTTQKPVGPSIGRAGAKSGEILYGTVDKRISWNEEEESAL